METLLAVLIEHDLFAITDEIYEYMVYDGGEHVSLASLPGAYERTITISGFSKTYNMTGWRLGYAVGPTSIIEPMGLLNDLFYICAPSPLQHGILEAFDMPGSYFDNMLSDYDKKRSMICETLEDVGFDVIPPAGSYYVFAGYRRLHETLEGFENDMAACETLIRETGVATIPGRSSIAVDPAFLPRIVKGHVAPTDQRPHVVRRCGCRKPPINIIPAVAPIQPASG